MLLNGSPAAATSMSFPAPPGDGPSLVSGVFLDVEPGNPAQDVLSNPMGFVEPLHEGLDCVAMVVAGLERTAFPPESRQGVLNLLGGQIGDRAEATRFRNSALGLATPFFVAGLLGSMSASFAPLMRATTRMAREV